LRNSLIVTSAMRRTVSRVRPAGPADPSGVAVTLRPLKSSA
jgi:hypothetical protein